MTKEEAKNKYQEVSKLLGKASLTRKEFCRESGIPKNQIVRLFGSFGAFRGECLMVEGKDILENQSIQIRGKNLDSVLESCGVDQKVWEVSEHNVKELANGEFLFTVYLKKKREYFNIDNVKQELKLLSQTRPLIKYPRQDNELLLEFFCPDLHLNKLSWIEETGQDYNSKIATELLRNSLDKTIQLASKFQVSHIVFPVGNDLFNIDSRANTTTAGTPQDVESCHHKMFREGYKLIIEVIERLKLIAPISVIPIVGNHDTNNILMLGEILDCFYHNDPNVFVDNRPLSRKYFFWGTTILGYTHGHEEKLNDLPLIMASECHKVWGNAKFKFWRIGHRHTQKCYLDEKAGVVIQHVSSLSAQDKYHYTKGYIGNNRGTSSSIIDKEEGQIAILNYNV